MDPYMRIYIILLFCLFCHPSVIGQIRLNGKVTGVETKGLEFVPVMLLRYPDSTLIKGALTDSSGNFLLNDMTPAEYYLAASNVGHEPYLKRITLVADTFLQIPLLPNANTLGTVTITSRSVLIEKKVDRLVFNVSNSVFAVGNSAWDMLKKAPGVIADENGQISIRAIPGAVVYLNDRRVYLSGEELMNMLKGLSAEELSKIEIIPNPPARYDAEGSGGVINIVLKQNLRKGFNGIVNGGYEQTMYGKGNGGLNLNYRNNKWYVFGSLNDRSGWYFKNENRDEQFVSLLNTTRYTENTDSKIRKDNASFVFGTDYALNQNHSLGILSDGNLTQRRSTDKNSGIYQSATQRDSAIYTTVDSRNQTQYFTCNLNYKGNLDTSGKSIQVDADYMYYTVPDYSALNSAEIFGRDNSLFLHHIGFESNTYQSISLYSFRADYTQPLSSEAKIDAGAKITNTITHNEVVFQDQQYGNTFVPDTSRSNSFRYTERTYAGYVNYNGSFKRTDVELGCRLEDTQALGVDKNDNTVLRKDYLKLFPSIFIQYKLTDKVQAGFTYNRRISRPPFAALNPFRNYRSPYSYSYGNPFLQPSYTDALEFSLTLHETWFLSAFYNLIGGQFSQVIEQDPLSNNDRYVWVNIDRSYNYGVSASTSFQPTKWWSINASLIFKINGAESGLLDNHYQYESGVFYIITNQSFRLSEKNNLQAELNENYASPGTVQGLFRLGSMLDVSAGIKKTFLNKKASVVLSFVDIFRGTYITASTDYRGQKSFVNGSYDQQGFRITFNYKFGNTGMEKGRKRDAVDVDEKQRIK
jgi:iron complex outermembrane receptor protein